MRRSSRATWPTTCAASYDYRYDSIISHGYGGLAATLVDAGLVDEIHAGIHPFLVGNAEDRLRTPHPVGLRLLDVPTYRLGHHRRQVRARVVRLLVFDAIIAGPPDELRGHFGGECRGEPVAVEVERCLRDARRHARCCR